MLETAPARDAEQSGAADAPVLRLARPGRTWRVVLALALSAAYASGSLVGQDSWWPFGPWRMFATSTAPSGNVTVVALQVTTSADPQWRDSGLTPANIGLNRAEVEGRQLQVAKDPMMLRTLATAHARMHPGDASWTGVRLVRRATVIREGRPTGELQESVLARWTSADGAQVVNP